MNITELLVLSLGLSMDAFAVSICKGLSIKNYKYKYSIITGLYFGCFQALMPLLGYFLGIQFNTLIVSIDHWIAFILLSIIGINMINESRKKSEEFNDSFSFLTMSPLAVATSIDALAIGITLAFLKSNIIQAVSIIGIITFSLSAIGIKIGQSFGSRLKKVSEIFGGIILIIIGIKILLDHLFPTLF